MPRGRFQEKSYYDNYRLNSIGIEAHHLSGDKKVVEETDNLKVAGMITYYEKELGRTLTPTDYERLVDFADTYPDGWFEKAVDEAVKNKATAPVPYIEKIMEKRLADGKHRKDDKGSRVEKLKQFRDG